MWIRYRAILLAWAIAAVLVPIGPQTAGAGGLYELCNDLIKNPDPDNPGTFICWFASVVLDDDDDDARSRAAISKPIATTQRMINIDGTLQPGEPTEGGKMTRTAWLGLKAPAAERIVIHTYGSTPWTGTGVFDTVLAAYRGTAIDNLTRVAGNDNTPVPGIANKHSLIQFDTVKGGEYRVQLGSRNETEGEFSLNVFRFPRAGGLSAFLLYYGGITPASPFNGRDYICDFYTGPSVTTTCPSATFIVHNSQDNALAVTASSTLGAGVTAEPATFSLAPGAIRVVTFTFGADFNKTKVRTDSEHFIFTGRRNGAVVTEARDRALVVARSPAPVEDLISSVAQPTVQTGHVNEPVDFTLTVTNTGTQTAIGCHVRSQLYEEVKADFHRIDPATGEQIGADNAPVNIPAGQSRTFRAHIASTEARDAYSINPPAIADCANNSRRAQALRSGFDISASNNKAPLPALDVTAAKPANGVLNVPANGTAFYTFRTTNRGTTRSLTVLPRYERPFDDDPNTAFQVAICRVNPATGKCIGGYTDSVTYEATKGKAFRFSVRVKAPANAPAYDPDKRRIYANFKLVDLPYFHIATPNIAVKKK